MLDYLPPAELWLPLAATMLAMTLASAFFSGSETALFSLTRDELRALRTGTKRERFAAALLQDPDRLLTAVLFWNLVVNLTYFAFSVVTAQRLAAAGYRVAAGGYSAIALVALIVLGEVVPKSVAVVFRRKLAVVVALPLAGAVRVLDPITASLKGVTHVLRRALWPQVENEPHLSPDDLERAVETSHHGAQTERNVLHGVLDLSEIRAEEAMRPRGTYLVASPPVSLSNLRGRYPPGGFVLIGDDGERIAGALVVSDFTALPTENLEDAAESVVHVPWCATLADVLQLLWDKVATVASVVNEYGETIGALTFDDIVDTAILPEVGRARRLLQREPVLKVDDDHFHVEGVTTLRHLSRRLGLEFAPAGDDEPVTVAGLLSERLERMPAIGDAIHWQQSWRMQVIEVDERGRLRVLIERDPAAALDAD